MGPWRKAVSPQYPGDRVNAGRRNGYPAGGEWIRKAKGAIEQIQNVKHDVIGSIHICSSFGTGKNHLTHPLSLFAKNNPRKLR